MKYARIREGKITGWTRWPNKQSSTPIDDTSQEWLDYIAERDRTPTPAERVNSRLLSDPVFRAVVQEIESRIPGFIDAAKARL